MPLSNQNDAPERADPPVHDEACEIQTGSEVRGTPADHVLTRIEIPAREGIDLPAGDIEDSHLHLRCDRQRQRKARFG